MNTRIKFIAALILCLINFRAVYAFAFDENTKISDVINNSLFGDYGNFIFPLNSSYYGGDTLENLRLTWYNNIKPARTVEIINYMSSQVKQGNKIFYRIYPENDPRSRNTGLFFFRGNRGAKFAICNAGGGFVYVGAIHDSFPHALELSKKGYNAFALIYRPGTDSACEDLARAIAFIHENAEILQVNTKNYSLWGGSAGARMAAWLGTYGTKFFGEKEFPRPSAVIMQYTGLSEITGHEPATYNCVGTLDGIADYRIMQNRINKIKAHGINAEIEIFEGLSHGFGLGEGTIAEGWLDRAVNFWEKQN
ncbi:MAG: alpha/beta hydrolase [Synergistaceae bacterium]|nr:alpha/beta hydrolase [Synergistaceae bacterium]